jgi:sirohydrochlorin cobaltochelatase
MNTGGKKGILVVSFGTSYPETRAVTIEACEKSIAQAFGEYEIRRAFTSHMVIKILAERDGIRVDKPEEALQKMYEEGFSEVIVQPLHIIPGEEFHEKIVKKVSALTGHVEKLCIGLPILSATEDFDAAIEAIMGQLPELREGEAVVLMGHGTRHPANAAYAALQHMLNVKNLPVYVGTVEGYPGLPEVAALLKQEAIQKVVLMPFMLVAGDHAIHDMAGDDDDSWKSRFAALGFEVEVFLRGLGENRLIREMYIKHVRDAITRGGGDGAAGFSHRR